MPLGPCEERQTEEDCLATDDGGGHNDCAWQTEFALWSEQDGCGEFMGPPRCLPVHYQGDGCWLPACRKNIFFHELGGGVVELMDYGGCELSPDGWQQCGEGQESPVCACFC